MGLFSAARLIGLVPVVVVSVDIIRRIIKRYIERKEYPLPPGPLPLPLLGSYLSVDIEQPWLTYTEWQAKYGDIVYLRLLDSDVVVLNSPSIAIDLLDKRSRIYSDRPFIATVDPYGHDCDFGLQRYGDHWRLCRRIFHQTFRVESAEGFRPMQLRRARQMIVNLIDSPDEYTHHFATLAAGVAMSAVYDYEPSSRNDPMVSIIDTFIRVSINLLTQEKALPLKTFPFLLYIPDWFPGSWIKRGAKESQFWRDKMLDEPYKYVQQRMESKDYVNTGMVPDHLARMEKFDESYRPVYNTALKHAAATTLMAAMESTSSTLTSFTLAMVENPHVFKRAQAEIDTVIGTGRLPEFHDRSSLPYVDAIVREILRWSPVVPLGVPHAVTSSDIYNNYYIPKGATIIANTWAMSRDEVRYPDAEKFHPERFLDSSGMLTDDDPGSFIFGFGRRVCPGRYTADKSIWTAIVTMLATLDFNYAKDADGNDLKFTPTYATGLTRHPDPFPCSITPRSHISKEFLARVLAHGD